MAVAKKSGPSVNTGKKTSVLGPDSSVPQNRPPIVAVVGHIDHGKTTLLDKIRESRIGAKESGGITQRIGASQVSIRNKEGETKKITFIDTPGHAAFTKMRARGVEVTDLAILVVAADSGVQEQTKESFDHIKAAKVPFLVALNKIDLPAADPERVKGQLAEIGIIPESYGGDVVVVPVSAKTGEGIEELLEMTVLIADLQELKFRPDQNLSGVVIEAALDRRKGPLATVLVKEGVLKTGDLIFAEDIPAKVKIMTDWLGQRQESALPGDPVEILGFEAVPAVGAFVSSSALKEEPKTEKAAVEEKETILKLIVKADVSGSLEAVLGGLPEGVEVIHSGVGEIGDSDIFLAQTTGAEIFGFNVGISTATKRIAEQNGIKPFRAEIIYEIFEEVDRRLKEKTDPLSGKEVLGKAEVVAEFTAGKKRVAGCSVLEGEMQKGKKVLLFRGDKVIGETVLASMRHLKEEIDRAGKDLQFGVVFSPPVDFSPKDVIIAYKHGRADAEG
ncbi:MAG: translation initiation factor IF-2 [Patescibacteria group bacterium]|nr:GTP-binding protein [Patescibacteria group bacterium]